VVAAPEGIVGLARKLRHKTGRGDS